MDSKHRRLGIGGYGINPIGYQGSETGTEFLAIRVAGPISEGKRATRGLLTQRSHFRREPRVSSGTGS